MEKTMTIGRLSIDGRFVAERTHDLEHPIRIGYLPGGGDPFDNGTPVVWCEFTESQFASLVAHCSRRGETSETFYPALAFIQTTGIEDELSK